MSVKDAAVIALKMSAMFALCVLAVASVMGCGGEEAPLPTREAVVMPLEDLSRDVASRLTESDLEDVYDEGIQLDVRGDLLFVKGIIDPNSRDDMYRALKDAPNVRVLVFTSIPGSADDETNLAVGRMLRAAGVTTYLPASGLIASGGVDLFLSGAERLVEQGALIGVHSWADGGGLTGDKIARDDPQHDLFLEYYREMGISEDFYWFTLEAAPAEDMHWMSDEEIVRYEIPTRNQ